MVLLIVKVLMDGVKMSEAELSVKAIQKIVNKLYKRELEFAERRGRVEELELIRKFNYEINNNTVSYTLIEEHCKKRLKELLK